MKTFPIHVVERDGQPPIYYIMVSDRDRIYTGADCEQEASKILHAEVERRAMSEAQNADARGSQASREAALAEARKNHAAAVELMELYADKARLLALAMISRDRFAAEIVKLGGVVEMTNDE